MAINSIEISNVMVFQHKNNQKIKNLTDDNKISKAFKLKFCDGINVLIGENGVGKTTILKMIYAATQCSFETRDTKKSKTLLDFFSYTLKNNDTLKSNEQNQDCCYYKISAGTHTFEYNLSLNDILGFDDWFGLNIESIFIPTTEMLSHSKGFLALNQKFNMPFDGTQIDIIVNASLPEAREIPQSMKGILDSISRVIDGTVVQEDDVFYVIKNDGHKIDFSLEAEGLQKLALLWKLIRNGLLEKDSILLWDEPEANLNPELYPIVADILIQLQKIGVQIFVATHNYNFAKYLEIRRTEQTQVMFHNLYKVSPNIPDNSKNIFAVDNKGDSEMYSDSSYRMEDLKQNHIMIADNKLLDEVYNM